MSDSSADSRQRGLFEVSRDAVLVHDLDDGHVVDANDAAERLLGYDASALSGLPLEALGADVDGVDETGPTLSAADVEDALEAARTTGEARFQWQIERDDGDGTIIEVSVTERSDTVAVADDGPGIADPERVLERGETAGATPGTGFGLYFVSSMMDAYGGSIEITENDPSGTVVTVELPAA